MRENKAKGYYDMTSPRDVFYQDLTDKDAAAASRRSEATWTGRRRSTPPSPGCISTARPCRGSKRGLANYNKSGLEPPDHAISRSVAG